MTGGSGGCYPPWHTVCRPNLQPYSANQSRPEDTQWANTQSGQHCRTVGQPSKHNHNGSINSQWTYCRTVGQLRKSAQWAKLVSQCHIGHTRHVGSTVGQARSTLRHSTVVLTSHTGPMWTK